MAQSYISVKELFFDNFIVLHMKDQVGERVSVIYDVSRPTRFTLTELPSDPLMNAACIIGGLILLGFSA